MMETWSARPALAGARIIYNLFVSVIYILLLSVEEASVYAVKKGGTGYPSLRSTASRAKFSFVAG